MSHQSSPAPTPLAVSKLTDGTVDVPIVAAATPFGTGYHVTVRMAGGMDAPTHDTVAGRYFLVRCGASTLEERLQNWQMYLRKPLFVAAVRAGGDAGDEWTLHIPDAVAPGHQWLLGLPAGAQLNLIGPLGNGFALDAHRRNLLLIGREARISRLLPLIDAMLDHGGRVTVVLVAPDGNRVRRDLMPRLPLAVELHVTDPDTWLEHVASLAQWPDQICAALPNTDLAALAGTIRRERLRFDPGLAFVLPDAELACGYGACLACVVPTANGGFTRACVNGPVFDLHRLVQA